VLVLGAALLAAPVASATTDRANYAAQVNPICASANAQHEAAYEAFLAKAKRQARKQKGRRGNSSAPFNFASLIRQGERIDGATQSALEAIPAAPGDEGIVATWLRVRRDRLNLDMKANKLTIQMDRMFNQLGKGSPRAFTKFERRMRRIDRQYSRLLRQGETLSDQNLELGTQLGATYCVTGATGDGIELQTIRSPRP
jgi:hypothetical protein